MINFSIYPVSAESEDFNNIKNNEFLYSIACSISENIYELEEDFNIPKSTISKYDISKGECSVGEASMLILDLDNIGIDDITYTLDEYGSGIHDFVLGEAIVDAYKNNVLDELTSRVCILDELRIYDGFKDKGLGTQNLSDILYQLKHLYHVEYVFIYPNPIYYSEKDNTDTLMQKLYKFYGKFGFKEMPTQITYNNNPFYYLEL